MSKYFGGSCVKDGLQRPLEAESFKEFVERYINVSAPINITREEFHKLSKKARGRKKDGPYFCACTFKEGSTKRNDGNAEAMNLIALDLDYPSEEDQEEGYVDYAKMFCEDPEALYEALTPLEFVAHETASSLPDRRCLRVIVSADNLDPSDYKAAVRTIAVKRLGMEVSKWKGERESQVTSQAMYRPVLFEGEEGSAVISSNTSGSAFDNLDIDPEVLKDEDIVYSYAYKGSKSDGSSLTDLPLLDVDLEEVEEALNSIDADCDYREWTHIACALRHQFREEEEAQAAFEMFDDWSSTGSKYQGDSDTRTKWRSFRPEAKGKRPVTIKSLYKMASDAGWDNRKALGRMSGNVEDWLAECEDVTLLCSEGPERIAAIPFRNAMTEDRLKSKLQTRLKELDAPTTKASVDKSVRKARRDANAEERGETIPSWVRPWVFISASNTFVNRDNGLELAIPAFDNTFSKELMPQSDKGEDMPEGKPVCRPSDYLLNKLECLRVDNVLYYPFSNGDDPVVELPASEGFKGSRFLNTYSKAGAVDPDESEVEEAERLFRKLLSGILPPEHVTVSIDSVAYKYQNVGFFQRWGMVIQSAEGAGKNLFGKILEPIFGRRNVKIASNRAMNSGFNDHTVGCLVLLLDETHAPGDNRKSQANDFKDLFANEMIQVTEKFKSPRMEYNTSLKYIFTNNFNAIHMDASDRRYMPVRSPLQTEEDIVALTATGHFDECARLLEPRLAAGLAYFLQNWKVSKGSPIFGRAPKTKYKEELIALSKNPLQAEIERIISEKRVPTVTEEIVHMTDLKNALDPELLRRNYKPSTYLQMMNYETAFGGQRVSIGGVRTQVLVHREKFDESLDDPAELLRSLTKKKEDKENDEI